MKEIHVSRTRKNQNVWSYEENKILLSANGVMTVAEVSELLPNRTGSTIRRKAGMAGIKLLRSDYAK